MGRRTRGGTVALVLVAATAGLALIGGLAFVCFVKVVGTVFLGAPRSASSSAARDPGASMTIPMIAGAILCAALGVAPLLPIGDLARTLLPGTAREIPAALFPLGGGGTAAAFAALAAIIGLLAAARAALLRRRGKRVDETWGCGFAYVTPRMQYTASSFADPILHVFRSILRPRARKDERLSGRFLLDMEYETHIGDLLENGLYLPVYRLFLRAAFFARRLHTGHTHLYIGYLLGTIVLLLILFR